MKTIAAQFAAFEQAVISPSAGRVQRLEMRTAFFGGATAMLTLMNMAAAADESDDVGATRLALLEQELRDFARDLGRAPR